MKQLLVKCAIECAGGQRSGRKGRLFGPGGQDSRSCGGGGGQEIRAAGSKHRGTEGRLAIRAR